jgi:heme exporter protein C
MTERRIYILAAVAVALVLAAGGLVFLYAPEDAVQGPVQRLFYIHVSSAVAAYYCFGLVVAGGALFLWRENIAADRWARSGALVGLMFTSVCLLTGMIWAKPVWNWDPSETWDARFTATVVLWIIYAGYLLVRKFAPPGRAGMRLAAVVGIAGFVDVPVVYFSVLWWRTLHPGPVIENLALPSPMLIAYLAMQVAMLVLALALVLLRYRIESHRDVDQTLAWDAAEPSHS